MRKIHIIALIILSAFLIYGSCKKREITKVNENFDFVDSSQVANIKLIQAFAGNLPQIPTAPNLTTGPQVFFYANGKKLNGNALSYGGVWPSPNTYAIAPTGNVTFHVVQARLNLSVVPLAPAPIAGDTLATFTTNLAPGKFYSFYMGDTVPFVRVKVVEDILTKPDEGTFKIRVLNYSMNIADTFYVFNKSTQTNIVNELKHKELSDWVQIPLPVLEADTFELRRKGSLPTALPTLSFTSSTFIPLRMYTLIVRGTSALPAIPGKGLAFGVITNR
jgi:hypothetical protein